MISIMLIARVGTTPRILAELLRSNSIPWTSLSPIFKSSCFVHISYFLDPRRYSPSFLLDRILFSNFYTRLDLIRDFCQKHHFFLIKFLLQPTVVSWICTKTTPLCYRLDDYRYWYAYSDFLREEKRSGFRSAVELYSKFSCPHSRKLVTITHEIVLISIHSIKMYLYVFRGSHKTIPVVYKSDGCST
jgi:hypothetical protein